MHSNEQSILAIAEILREAAAMNDAALAGDLDEARFRAQLIAKTADAGDHLDLVLAAGRLLHVLGPTGTTPLPGYGACILRITTELERIGFDPL
jgi:hypothetical protein